jgi:hypothetical protein
VAESQVLGFGIEHLDVDNPIRNRVYSGALGTSHFAFDDLEFDQQPVQAPEEVVVLEQIVGERFGEHGFAELGDIKVPQKRSTRAAAS